MSKKKAERESSGKKQMFRSAEKPIKFIIQNSKSAQKLAEMSEHEVDVSAQKPISMPKYQNPFNLGDRLSINLDKLMCER